MISKARARGGKEGEGEVIDGTGSSLNGYRLEQRTLALRAASQRMLHQLAFGQEALLARYLLKETQFLCISVSSHTNPF